MLPLENRLKNKKEFSEAQRFGFLVSFGDIFLKIKKNNLEKTRIGISVGLKFSKKAIERNRIKRQIREISREYIEKINPNVDIVISVKKGENTKKESKDLKSCFENALKKAGLIKGAN